MVGIEEGSPEYEQIRNLTKFVEAAFFYNCIQFYLIFSYSNYHFLFFAQTSFVVNRQMATEVDVLNKIAGLLMYVLDKTGFGGCGMIADNNYRYAS